MLRKKERLSRSAFNRFFSVGKRYHSPTLQLIFSPYNELHASVVVSKKIEKGAVGRNKIRRRIYDIIRRLHSETPLTGVFIILTKSPISTLTYETLKGEVRTIISQTQKVR